MKLGIIRTVVASPADVAAQAINALGVDLLPKVAAPDDNALFSPYSILSALAMAYAGAGGETRVEMARALRFPADETALHLSFVALRKALQEITRQTTGDAASARSPGGASEPVILTVANRLFGQEGFEFLAPFLATLRDKYEAPLSVLDFAGDPASAARHINEWVEDRTQWRISDFIPPGALKAETRLVLANAIFLKAPWEFPFNRIATKPCPFSVRGETVEMVSTMAHSLCCGYAELDDARAVTMPYHGGEIHLLILLPNEVKGLGAVERQLNGGRLAELARLDQKQVGLVLPKLHLTPASVRLTAALSCLGLKTAFDQPPGSADFERMARRHGDNYLVLSEVLHKAFLKLDERGTEAAAATAAAVAVAGRSAKRPDSVEFRVDRPYLFAIQHRASGACLFLGRVTDPR